MQRNLIQLQPQYAQSEEWMQLAEREDVCFEAADFFMPQILQDPALVPEVKEWYQKSGRASSLHGAFVDVNPASADPEFLRVSQKRCRESCELAKEIGASHVVLHSSCFPFLRGAYLDNWAAKCAVFYEELASSYDLTLYIENSQDVDPTPLTELMKRVTTKDVKVCLDVGHAHYSQAPVEKWFEALGESIAYLHLSDNMGSFDDHLPLGQGNIDWAKVYSLWKQLGKTMPITLEVGGINGTELSLKFLKENGYFL